MVNYGVIEEKMCDLCMGEYITYGIGAYNTQAHELITFVSDVFPCKDDAEKFVNVCNENELSLHHLRDVIEDFICNKKALNTVSFVMLTLIYQWNGKNIPSSSITSCQPAATWRLCNTSTP